MNTHAEYRRHGHRLPELPAANPASEDAGSLLARHRDPSLELRRTSPAAPTKGIAWVRPTDLAAYASPMVGRGIDRQAELIRRARRTPATTTRALNRGLPHKPAPTPPVSRQEGLQL
ncbi:hypothetical protein GCM10023350_48890 [Nocardioides endophyticus]|uniref:Uncharacterized protein n=1 Tax=Nocardioides endophyticus TaxID=1353775 RepID=A0ABP8ZJ39_9ACTN